MSRPGILASVRRSAAPWSFTETWTGTNGDPWPADWSFINELGATVTSSIQSNRGRLTASGVVYGGAKALLDSALIADFDLTVSMGTADTGEQYPAIHFRTDTGGDEGYFLGFGTPWDEMFLNRVTSGVETTLAQPAFTTNTTARRWVRIQAIGTAIKAKAWLVGNAEPGTWDIEVTDSDHATGRFLLAQAQGNATTARTVDWDDLSITEL